MIQLTVNYFFCINNNIHKYEINVTLNYYEYDIKSVQSLIK